MLTTLKTRQNLKMIGSSISMTNFKDLADRLNSGSALTDEDKKALTDGLNTFKSTF